MDDIHSAVGANEVDSMPEVFQPTGEPRTARIALDRIEPDPLQPRKHFDQKGLEELADNLRVSGLLQAPAVRPHPDPVKQAQGMFMLICGERRWRASHLAGFDDIRVEIHEGLTELDVRRHQFSENFARRDLNLVEEAEALQASIERLEGMGYQAPQRTLAAALGQHETKISRKLRVLKYSPEVRGLVRDGIVTQLNALPKLDQLKPVEREFFVGYAREAAAAGAVPDVAGFLKSPKRFMQQLQAAATPGDSQDAERDKRSPKVSQWSVRWAVGRAEFSKLVAKTGFELQPEVLANASDEELRKHFEDFRTWLLDVKALAPELAPTT